MNYAALISDVPQTEKPIGKPMVPNNAEGYSFTLDDWGRLDRFLILGSDGGTYYVGERKLTRDNAECVVRCVRANGFRAVKRIVEISDSGRAPKNSPAIFALALAAEYGDEETKATAYRVLPLVCRTGTHLFEFVGAKKTLGGAFGSGCRRAISRWYTDKTPDDLAYQLVKYRQRGGWTHRDVLRLARPTKGQNIDALLRWTTHGDNGFGAITKGVPARNYPVADPFALPDTVINFGILQETKDVNEAVKLLERFRLPWECVPTEHLKSPKVWEALLPSLPLTATVRNLGRMTANGLIRPLSDASKIIKERLRDQEYIKKSRLHPLSILLALKTYSDGHGDKGSLTWTPDQGIVDALSDAFYLSFGNVERTNKRFLLALDVSGSMGATIAGTSLSCREASAAMALVTAAVEPECYVFGFSTRFVPLEITAKMRLDQVVRKISGLPFAGTDCGLPMVWAKENKINADVFSVYTDNETYAGPIHPYKALQNYRSATGIAAKSAVVGMTATEFTIADPSDAGMCDFVGFDTSTPAAIAAFVGG